MESCQIYSETRGKATSNVLVHDFQLVVLVNPTLQNVALSLEPCKHNLSDGKLLKLKAVVYTYDVWNGLRILNADSAVIYAKRLFIFSATVRSYSEALYDISFDTLVNDTTEN